LVMVVSQILSRGVGTRGFFVIRFQGGCYFEF
jgi:hypothetical protein